MPGSPEDEAWREGHAASFLAAAALGRRSSGMSILDRTRVLSGAPVLPSTAVAVPVDRPAQRDPAPDGGVAPLSPLIPGIAGGQAGGGVPARPFAPAPVPSAAGTATPGPATPPRPRPPEPRPLDPNAPSASRGALGAIAVLEALAAADDEPGAGRRMGTEAVRGGSPVGVADLGAPAAATAKPRAPASLAPIVIAPAAVGLKIVTEGAMGDERVEGRQTDGEGTAGAAGVASGSEPGTDPCGSNRVRVDERCAVASTAADQAKIAADALREAQRAYDTLRERLDRAQADADPRELAAGKDELHRRFRAASEGARRRGHRGRRPRVADPDQRAQRPDARPSGSQTPAAPSCAAPCRGSSGSPSRRTRRGSAPRTPRPPAATPASGSPPARRPRGAHRGPAPRRAPSPTGRAAPVRRRSGRASRRSHPRAQPLVEPEPAIGGPACRS